MFAESRAQVDTLNRRGSTPACQAEALAASRWSSPGPEQVPLSLEAAEHRALAGPRPCRSRSWLCVASVSSSVKRELNCTRDAGLYTMNGAGVMSAQRSAGPPGRAVGMCVKSHRIE